MCFSLTPVSPTDTVQFLCQSSCAVPKVFFTPLEPWPPRAGGEQVLRVVADPWDVASPL